MGPLWRGRTTATLPARKKKVSDENRFFGLLQRIQIAHVMPSGEFVHVPMQVLGAELVERALVRPHDFCTGQYRCLFLRRHLWDRHHRQRGEDAVARVHFQGHGHSGLEPQRWI